VPAARLRLADGTEALVATVFDLQVAQYGIDRGLGSGAGRLRRQRAVHAGLAGGRSPACRASR
jgi:nitrate reductase alpha subunit